MARVVWIGEDDLHSTVTSEGVTVEGAGPSFTNCFGIKFPKGEPIEVKNMAIIAKAKINKFFKVEGAPGRPPKAEDGNEN